MYLPGRIEAIARAYPGSIEAAPLRSYGRARVAARGIGFEQ
jgi:hypothetical protein